MIYIYIYIYIVFHVWYIRCDSSGVIEMPPPPPASRQASPAIQQRGALVNARVQGPGPALLDGWAGLAAGRRRHLDHT